MVTTHDEEVGTQLHETAPNVESRRAITGSAATSAGRSRKREEHVRIADSYSMTGWSARNSITGMDDEP